jgi:hypothetical protein
MRLWPIGNLLGHSIGQWANGTLAPVRPYKGAHVGGPMSVAPFRGPIGQLQEIVVSEQSAVPTRPLRTPASQVQRILHPWPKRRNLFHAAELHQGMRI